MSKLQSLLAIAASAAVTCTAFYALQDGPFDGSKKSSNNLSEPDAYAKQVNLQRDSAEPGSP